MCLLRIASGLESVWNEHGTHRRDGTACLATSREQLWKIRIEASKY